MPRTKRVPAYLLHKPSGRARVRINGKDHYLGKYGSRESRDEYQRVIAQWLASERRDAEPPSPSTLTIVELMVRYLDHCRKYYGQSNETEHIGYALKPLRELYGRKLVSDLGPLALKAVREKMIAGGLTRSGINKRIHRIRRMFRWGVENELVTPSVYHALKEVAALTAGRSEAKESKPVEAISDDDIEAIKPYVLPQVWAMVVLQRYSGMRPGEVVKMQMKYLDRTGDVWLYQPDKHKNAHRGHRREAYLGPKSQAAVTPFLKADPDAHLFSPAEAMEWHLQQREAKRTTRSSCGHRRGNNRVSKPQKVLGDCYTVSSYRKAIKRACVNAGIDPWTPNQIRHTAGTETLNKMGLVEAQALLGHRHARTSEIYGKPKREQGIRVAREVG